MLSIFSQFEITLPWFGICIIIFMYVSVDDFIRANEGKLDSDGEPKYTKQGMLSMFMAPDMYNILRMCAEGIVTITKL